jgi:hypothetical protein
MQSIEDGDDLEWNFNAYVIMCASRVFGQSAVRSRSRAPIGPISC